MKTIAFLMVFLPSVAFAGDWDRAEKVLFGSFIALEIIDYGQTIDIIEKGRELNPVVNYAYKKADKFGVALYFGAFAGATYLIADKIFPEHKKQFLTIWDSIYLGVDGRNYTLGYRWKF